MASDDSFSYSLLAPGPVNIHPDVRQALSLPMIHHRTPEFDKILKKVLQGMKTVFQTAQDVYMLTSTGSGGMEALLVNLMSPGEKVLAIVSGKFGERWAEMAKVFGAEVITYNVPWGEAAEISEVQNLLRQHPDTKLVLCQACETSTAVAHPIREIAEVIHKLPNTLFLVDAITALGAYPLPMDEWHIDGIVAGSQKAFMLPTGMSFVSLSAKAWQHVENAKCPRFYFDLRKEKKANSAGETFYSSNVAVIRGLAVVLDMIEQRGLNALFHDIQRRAEFTRKWGQKLGLKLYAKSPSDSVTALMMPTTIDGQKVRLHLEEKYNITIMGGQDQAKGKIIRIGHMGYIRDAEMVHLLESLGKTLQHFDPHFISDADLIKLVADAKADLEKHS
ncbi:pyridoxal-phosphate-dependent aminotransferase family protein [Bdellovibrio sp. HCB2-146]|uniref:pyridoxal-phosphate-dependent aminotransferase family protein n=1 Tax=Bdellovibrio sp. HCB2-146 TaxID=3394362 RepID=UPI0039BC9348